MSKIITAWSGTTYAAYMTSILQAFVSDEETKTFSFVGESEELLKLFFQTEHDRVVFTDSVRKFLISKESCELLIEMNSDAVVLNHSIVTYA